MINLILIILLLHYFLYLILNPKGNSGVLGCGIFAYLGNDPANFDKAKFDILGIMNETRGTDSCGITADGEIYTGTYGLKKYRDFVSTFKPILPNLIPSVIGHTRASTVGANTDDNAHPFGFGSANEGEGYAFVGVHNGTLVNHEDLAKAFEIDTREHVTGKVPRTKIDSELLLEILYTSGNFKVLSQYDGAAALIFQNLEEPNVVYCYHGKSKKWNTDKFPSEERPLFYYKESKNSLYVSSIEDSLKVIGGDEDTIGEFEHNIVYKITDGDIENAVKIRVSRQARKQKKSYTSGAHTTTKKTTPNNSTVGKQKALRARGENTDIGELNNIYNEKPIKNLNDYKGKVIFNKLRYSSNGHKINGYWTRVDGHGFYYLGDTEKEAEARFWMLVNSHFVDGEFVMDPKTMKDSTINRAFIPFVNSVENPIVNPPIYIFYEGIRVETTLDYEGCLNMESISKKFDIPTLSICSKHPIMDTTYNYRPENLQEIYWQGELFTGTFAPLGSERSYEIEDGNLISMVDNKSKETKVISLDAAMEELPEEEEKGEYDDDLVFGEIDKMFLAPYDNFPRYKKTLQKHLPNKKAAEAIKIIDTFMTGTHKLIAIEEK